MCDYHYSVLSEVHWRREGIILDEVKPKVETFNNQRSKKNRNNEWLAPELNLEKAKFDYEGGMKTEYFNIRVNLLAEYMANLMKHNGPQ